MGILDILHDYKLRAFPNLSAPAMADPTVEETSGSTTYDYCATFETLVGETTASAVVSTTTGHAAPNGVNRVKLQLASSPPAGVQKVRFFKKSGIVYKLLSEAEVSSPIAYDIGQTLTNENPPTTNTSGRPNWVIPLFNKARRLQRAEMSDMTALLFRAIEHIGDVIHRNGDVISGLVEKNVGTNEWEFSDGIIYVDGMYVAVTGDTVTLTGTGKEVVGIKLTPAVIDHNDDVVLRNPDEEVAWQYCNPGADRLVIDGEWTVDDAEALPIKEFLDGVPKLVRLPPERTELDRTLARRVHDLAGDFSVKNFPLQVVDHISDNTKLTLRVGPGVAYPNGWEVRTQATQTIDFNKARVTESENNSGTDVFSIPGGFVITTNAEPFDLDGLKAKFKVGDGNSHIVTFVGDELTAVEVGEQIEAVLNAYPTDGDLIECTASADGYLQIQAIDGKTLAVQTQLGDGYTQLGISVGTYTPVGTRIYPINEPYVKTVTDMNYKREVVEAVVHDGNDHIDDLANAGVVSILGAANSVTNCHDGKWDYEDGVDFERDGNAISYAGMGGSEPTHGQTYYVKYQYNLNATKGARVLVRVTDARIVKGAEDGADRIVFTGGTAKKVINNETVPGLSGEATDVVRILRVNDSAGQSQDEYSLYALLKNATGLVHNTSEIDWSAAGAQGVKPLGQPATGNTYYATFEYWRHTVEGDFVTADSYDMYEEIERFLSQNLRDAIDFRTVNGKWPVPGEDPTFDYEYYVGRYDKLVLSDAGDFSFATGTPGKYAPVPSEQEGRLTLAVIYVPPYTYSAGSVGTMSVEPVRITQRGIRDLANRIERLEYWAVVNNWEKEVAQHPAAAAATGIFTDALTGFGRLDVAFDKNGITHNASLDRLTRRLCLPPDSVNPRTLSIDLPNSEHVRRVGNTLVLDYQPEVFDSQTRAGITVNAAVDFTYDDYWGHIEIEPMQDFWMDEEQLPQANVDFDNNLAEALNLINGELFNQITWGNWRADVTGATVFGRPQTGWQAELIASNAERSFGNISNLSQIADMAGAGVVRIPAFQEGSRQVLVPGRIEQSLGDRVVDLSLVPMLRTKNDDGDPFEISVKLSGLVPNQDHACSFAARVVDFTQAAWPQGGTKGAAGTHTYQGCTTVCTDNEGRLTAKFTVPEGIPRGQAVIEVFHYNLPTHSRARGTFYGAGMVQTNQNTVLGIPTIQARTETFRQDTVLAYDPICQTVIIKEPTYVSECGVFFRGKSATLPIRCEIHNVVNGYPGPVVYQSTYLEPDEITCSDDASVETRFQFDTVVMYPAGTEIGIVIIPGKSNIDYEIWAAELGTVDTLTGNIIGPPMHDGVLFHSPNNRTWEPWTKRDLKFNLYKSNFENNCQVVWQDITGIEASRIALAVQEYVGAGVVSCWSYSLDGGTKWIPFDPGIDIVLEEIVTEVKLRIDVTSNGGSYQIVEKIAGILFLTHAADANSIWKGQSFTDILNLPNKVVATIDIDADGTNGAGVTSLTPYYSVDDGDTWVEVAPSEGYTPIAQEDPWYRYQFETPDQATITGATNAAPIVLTAAGHGFKNNAIITVAEVAGNTAANGTWRVQNAATDTLELIDPDTGGNSSGNGAYTTGGVIDLTEFDSMKPRVNFATTNQARTPSVHKAGFICSRVEV